jgi:hypothetical protein
MFILLTEENYYVYQTLVTDNCFTYQFFTEFHNHIYVSFFVFIIIPVVFEQISLVLV